MSDTPRRRSWLRRAIGPLVALLLTLGLVEIGMRILTTDRDGEARLLNVPLVPRPVLLPAQLEGLSKARTESPYFVPDPELGWTVRRGGQHPSAPYASDGAGLRVAAATPEATGPDPSLTTVLLVGDSYTHGDEVRFEDTWGAQLEGLLPDEHRVLNLGVSGYGTDQAILRMERRMGDFQPQVVVLGLYHEDLMRNLSLFRVIKHLYTGFPFGKPRFILEGGELRLIHQPVTPPEEVAARLASFSGDPLREHAPLYEPSLYEPHWSDASRLCAHVRSRRVFTRRHNAHQALMASGGEADRLGVALCQRFSDSVLAAGAQPILLLLHDKRSLGRILSDAPDPFAGLRQGLAEAGLQAIDPGRALCDALAADEGPGALFMREDGSGHPNGRANAIIAEALRRELQ